MWLTELLDLPQACGWPDRQAFVDGDVHIDEAMIEGISARLAASRAVCLAGPEGRGKTTIARVFGFHRQRADEEIWHIDLARSSEAERRETIHKLLNLDVLVVVENVQANPPAFEEFYDSFLRSRHSRLLFSERRLPNEASVAEAFLAEQEGRRIPQIAVAPSLSTYRAIIDLHLRRSDLALARPGEEALIRIRDRLTGENLRVLRAFMDAWKEGDLVEVPVESVLSRVFDARFASLNAPQQMTLLRLSAIAQFGVSADAEVFDGPTLATLAERGLVGLTVDGLRQEVSIAHRTDAQLNVRAYAGKHGDDWQDLGARAVAEYIPKASGSSADRLLLQIRRVSPKMFRGILSNSAISDAWVDNLLRDARTLTLGYVVFCLSVLLPDDERRLRLCQSLFKLGDDELREVFARSNLMYLDHFEYHLGRIAGAGPLRRHAQMIRGRLRDEDWRRIWINTPLAYLTKFIWRYAKDPDLHRHTVLAREVLAEVAAAEDFAARVNALSLEPVGKLVWIAGRFGEPAASLVAQGVASSLKVRREDPPLRLGLIAENMRRAGQVEASDMMLRRILATLTPDDYMAEASGEGLSFVLGNVEQSVDSEVVASGRILIDACLAAATGDLVSAWSPKALAKILWTGVRLSPERCREWLASLDPATFDRPFEQADRWTTWLLLWNVWQADPGLADRLARRNLDLLLQRSMDASSAQLPLLGFLRWRGIIGDAGIPAESRDSLEEALLIPNRGALFCALHAIEALGEPALGAALALVRGRLAETGNDPEEFLRAGKNPRINGVLEACFVRHGLLPESSSDGGEGG
jgi:hypothetical protein